MKYTKEQYLDTGKRVFTHELKYDEAMTKYNVCRTAIAIAVKNYKKSIGVYKFRKRELDQTIVSLKEDELTRLNNLNKEQLIDETIKSKIGELRLKKGYEVKGDGANKEYVSIFNKNTK